MLKLDHPSTRSDIAGAAEAQRIIDEQIAAHYGKPETAICDLKTRRNTYSSISRLPVELFTSIFLSVKHARIQGFDFLPILDEGDWTNITMVCRRWREIALASVRLWSSIIISQPNRALRLLERSKSAPLQVTSGSWKFMSTERGEAMAKRVMGEVRRIQTLHVSARTGRDVLKLLRLNALAPAPLLERLHLAATVSPYISLPPDILDRKMPTLRHLYLHNITLPPKLPPLPHLASLKICVYPPALHPSCLVAFIQHSTKLEDIEISGLVKDESAGSTKTSVQLPNLSRISIEAGDLETCAIFASLHHPHNKSLSFVLMESIGELDDLSILVQLCEHFAGATIVDEINISSSDSSLCFKVFRRSHPRPEPPYLSLSLEPHDHVAACVAFFSVLPLQTASTLVLEGFKGMPREGWTSLFSVCKGVKHLAIQDALLADPFQALTSGLGARPPLPLLQTVKISACQIAERHFDLDDPSSAPFHALMYFLWKRKYLEIPITEVRIVLCSVPKKAIKDLKDEDLAIIAWDGAEVYSDVSDDSDIEDYYSDRIYWGPGHDQIRLWSRRESQL